MAIFDAMLELSNDQDLGANADSSTEASTNIIDFVISDVEIGAGNPLWLNIKVGTEAISNTDSDATLTVALCRDTVAPIDSSSTVIYQTAAIAQTALTAGTPILRMPLPNNVDEDRIVGLLYMINGSSNSTAGTVDAWIDNGAPSSFNTQVSASNI